MNWFKKSLTVVLATLTLFGTGITTPIVADDGETNTTDKTVDTVNYPAFDYAETVDDVVVSLHAEEGILPSGTTAKVESVTEQVAAGLEGTYTEYKAFDINLYDANGIIIDNDSWNGKVEVTFSGTEIEKMQETADVSIVNVDETGNIKEEKEITNKAEDEVSFEAEHFSIYVVGTQTTAGNENKSYTMWKGETITLNNSDYSNRSGYYSGTWNVSDSSKITLKNSNGDGGSTQPTAEIIANASTGNGPVKVTYTYVGRNNVQRVNNFYITVKKLTVSFDENGGSIAAPESQTVENKNDTIILPGYDGTNGDYEFIGWAENSTLESIDYYPVYSAGSTYAVAKGTTLYAVWSKTANGTFFIL